MTIAAIMPQLQRAQAMLQAGQAAQAWALISPFRPAIFQHSQALRLYALVAQQVGRIGEAKTALEQVAELEGNPPEILGAMADMLGNAGQHEEALACWDKLVAGHPELADAHLNRAITAANAGRHDLALDAADAGLRRFPGHARLLATKAMALKNVGRIAESLGVFTEAVAADPGRALTRHNQAVALRAACRFEEACDAYAEAGKLGMAGAQFHANWAAAALEAGRVDQSVELYERALKEDPSHEESRRGLTRLRIEFQSGQDAFAHYERAASDRPEEPRSWFAWASALIANRRSAEALEVAEQGLRIHPSSRELKIAQCFAQGMLGNAAPALDELDSLVRGTPDEPAFQTLITQLSLRAGRPERAAALLEEQVTRNFHDQLAWSLLGLAWRLLDDPREQWLCDYERLVMVVDVPSADGRLDPGAYAEEVAAMLDPLHVTRSEPGDQSLRGGTQTSGSLFSRPEPDIQRFREAVTLAARGSVAKLPDDPTHPFLSRKSDRFGFSGSWSVRLSAGGHHVSHVHPEGWMSSAYYARLPSPDDAASSRHEGWIQFGVPPEHLGIELEPRRLVEPRPGRLVLFPSYLWHGTIPFSSGDRLTAAFDYQPL